MSEEDVVSPEQLAEDSTVRKELEKRLSNGLQTEIEPRAYSHEEVLELVARLQDLSEADYDSMMVVAGFTPKPYGEEDDEQACETCMYYKVHRKFCELPELMLPVEPEWSCRLWRI